MVWTRGSWLVEGETVWTLGSWLVEGEMEWTLGSWLVEGGSKVQTKVHGSGRGMTVVAQGKERQNPMAA